MQNFMSFLVLLTGEERAGCSTFIVLLMSHGCYFYLPLPHKPVGRSAVCDCSISWSHSLSFLLTILIFTDNGLCKEF